MGNATKYHQSQKEISIQLVKDAIKHIQDLGGVVNQSSVSRITFDIADVAKKQKGLTPGAISKNEIYKTLVDEAIAMGSKTTNKSSLNDYSEADVRIQLAAIRVKYSLLKDENKILKTKQEEWIDKELNNDKNIIHSTTVGEDELLYKQALKDMVSSLLMDSLCYIDKDTGGLKLSLYETLLLDEAILEKLGIKGDF